MDKLHFDTNIHHKYGISSFHVLIVLQEAFVKPFLQLSTVDVSLKSVSIKRELVQW